MSSTITALTSGGGLAMAGDTSGQLELKTNNGTTAVTISTGQTTTLNSAASTAPLIAQINSTEVVRIDSSGNVGINQSTPAVIATAKQLAVKAPTNGDALFVSQNSNGLTTFIAGYYGVTAGPDKPVVGSYSNDPVAYITNNTERMRIDTGGRVLIGTTNTTPPASNAYGVVIGDAGNGTAYAGVIQASANGNSALILNRGSDAGSTVVFRQAGTSVGSISVTGSATAYNTSSDYRLKEDITPMTGALAKVQELKPCTYTWKSTRKQGEGFIAHELAEVVPDCVTGEKDAIDTEGNPEYQGIDTSFLVATLTAAIQELNAKVDAQALEIQALKGVA